MTEMERNNKIAMMTHGINVGIMAAFLILQAVAGELSIIYVAVSYTHLDVYKRQLQISR